MLNYDIRSRGNKTKTIYLYDSIKRDILNGTLMADEKLPSKRELAEHLSVSVITVENAYAMLEEEGYIYSKPRSGFFTCNIPVASLRALNEAAPAAAKDLSDMKNPEAAAARALSAAAAGRAATDIQYLPEDEQNSERQGESANLARYVRKVLTESPDIMHTKPPHLGCAVLRNAIAGFLRRYRSMNIKPSNIIIGSGAEYLYGTIVQLFGRETIYGIEFPSYEKIELVYRANGAKIEYLNMGQDGIMTSSLEHTRARILHVSPYHSYPTGVTAPAEKRYEYLAWAERTEGYIIEDDFDSEFAFYRKPIDPLFSMDRKGKVIYMNTFSRSISPSIRTAYMILPDDLLSLYTDNLGFYSCPVPVLDQYALASFIEEGAFERHLGRLRHRNTPGASVSGK